jgi:rhodanese-related sulfurtransferase
LLDVRSAAEFTRDGAPAAVHAPGGQLLQATDQAIGVRRARVLLVDHDKVRAPVFASWLTQMGIETALVASRDAAALRRPASGDSRNLALDAVFIDANGLRALHGAHALHLIDLRSSAAYRTGHAAGARWSIRPRLLDTLAAAALSDPVVLFADTPALAALAALNLREAGFTSVSIAANGVDTWMQAGLPLESSPSVPEDHERIDYLSFVHDRHGGNLDAARAYLAWETGLIAQCAPDELGHFRLDAQASEAATAH